MKVLLLFLAFFILESCSRQHDTPVFFKQVEDVLLKAKHTTKLDTVCFGVDREDSIIRVAPIFFAGKPAFLLAKFENGFIYQYDLVFTQNISVISRVLNLFQTPKDDSTPIDTNYVFATRPYSSRDEFNEIQDSIKAMYGMGQRTSDTSFIWREQCITLKSLNEYTTTIVSFYQPNRIIDDRYDWEFCAVVSDTLLLNYPIGIPRNELEALLPCKDTNVGSQINPDRKTCVAELTAWGIRGTSTFDFDKNGNVTKFVWNSRSNSRVTKRYAFEAVCLFIDDYYKRTHSIKDKKEDMYTVLYTWENAQETIYAYLLSNEEIFIGKAPKSFMKNFK